VHVLYLFLENPGIFRLRLLRFERICKGFDGEPHSLLEFNLRGPGIVRVGCSGLSGCGARAVGGEIKLAEVLADHAVGVESDADGGHGMLHHREPAAGKVGAVALVIHGDDLFFEQFVDSPGVLAVLLFEAFQL
jgi:hypothetical protein